MLTIIASSTAHAQLFTPSVNLQATFSDSSIIITIGETSLSGTLHGYDAGSLFEELIPEDFSNESFNMSGLEGFIDRSLLDHLHIIPLLSSALIADVEKITLINTTLFEQLSENISDPMELLTQFRIYEDVTIQIGQGMSLFGLENTTVEVSCNAPYALSGSFEFPIDDEMTLSVIGMLTQQASSLHYNGSHCILYSVLDSTTITLMDSEGTIVAKNSGPEYFFYLEDSNLIIQDTSPLHLYPINDSGTTRIKVMTRPADSSIADITSFIALLDETQLGEQKFDLPFDLENDSIIQNMITTINPISNGIILMMNSTSFNLNQQAFDNQSFVFSRAEQIEMAIDTTQDQPKQITGDAQLVFLGSHFYAPQASDDNHGLFIPLLPVLFWIFAIAFFVAVKRYPLPKVNKSLDEKLKLYGLIIHIIMLIISFILLDLIISTYFSLSFLTSLLNQSFYLVALGFLAFQLFLWTLGYIFCSFPLHYIFKILFRFIGIKKSGNEIGKGISSLGIPLFAGFYIILFLNILLFFIDIPLPMPPM